MVMLNWTKTPLLRKMADLAARRKLDDLTVGPVLTVSDFFKYFNLCSYCSFYLILFCDFLLIRFHHNTKIISSVIVVVLFLVPQTLLNFCDQFTSICHYLFAVHD